MRWSCIFLCTGLSWYDIIRWVYVFWRNLQFTWPSLFSKFLRESEAILLLYLTKKCCVLVIAVVCFKIWLIGVFHWCFQWSMRLLRKEKLKKGRKIAFRPQVLIGSCRSTFFFLRISSSCLLFTKFPLLSTIYIQTYSYNSWRKKRVRCPGLQ